MIIKTGSRYLGQILLVASLSLFSAQLHGAESQSVSDSLLYPATSEQAAIEPGHNDKGAGEKEVTQAAPNITESNAQAPNAPAANGKKDEISGNAVSTNIASSVENNAASSVASTQNQVRDSLLPASGMEASVASTSTSTAPEAFGLNNGHSETAPAYNRAEPVSIGKFVVYSFGVLGLIFLLAYCLRRLKLVPGGRAGNLGIITALAVGQKEKLVLVRVGNEQLLVGVTPHNVNLVYRLPEPITADGDSRATGTGTKANTGFKDILARFHRDGNSADANANKTSDLNSVQTTDSKARESDSNSAQ